MPREKHEFLDNISEITYNHIFADNINYPDNLSKHLYRKNIPAEI